MTLDDRVKELAFRNNLNKKMYPWSTEYQRQFIWKAPEKHLIDAKNNKQDQYREDENAKKFDILEKTDFQYSPKNYSYSYYKPYNLEDIELEEEESPVSNFEDKKEIKVNKKIMKHKEEEEKRDSSMDSIPSILLRAKKLLQKSRTGLSPRDHNFAQQMLEKYSPTFETEYQQQYKLENEVEVKQEKRKVEDDQPEERSSRIQDYIKEIQRAERNSRALSREREKKIEELANLTEYRSSYSSNHKAKESVKDTKTKEFELLKKFEDLETNEIEGIISRPERKRIEEMLNRKLEKLSSEEATEKEAKLKLERRSRSKDRKKSKTRRSRSDEREDKRSRVRSTSEVRSKREKSEERKSKTRISDNEDRLLLRLAILEEKEKILEKLERKRIHELEEKEQRRKERKERQEKEERLARLERLEELERLEKMRARRKELQEQESIFTVRKPVRPATPPIKTVFRGQTSLEEFPTFKKIAEKTVSREHREKRHFPKLQHLDHSVEIFRPKLYIE